MNYGAVLPPSVMVIFIIIILTNIVQSRCLHCLTGSRGIWIREPLYRKRPILIIRSDYWFNLLKSIHTLYLPHKKPCFISAGEQRTSGGRSKSNNSPDPNSTNPPPPLPPMLTPKMTTIVTKRTQLFPLKSLYIWSLSDSCVLYL